MPRRSQFRFEKLTVWQSARRLSRQVYLATKSFPAEEQFALTNQFRRAAVSIGSNIAEGSGRNSDQDFARFLEIAYGSSMETASLLFTAADLEYLGSDSCDSLLAGVSEVSAQLASLNRSLSVRRSKTPFSRRAE